MKNLLLAVFCLTFSVATVAQKSPTKKSLFDKYPATIKFPERQLEALFTYSENMDLNVEVSGNFKLIGKVMKKYSNASNIQTMGIILQNFENIVLSVAKIKLGDGSIVYNAHLIAPYIADGYQLKRNKEDNTYDFVKVETEKVLPTCNQH